MPEPTKARAPNDPLQWQRRPVPRLPNAIDQAAYQSGPICVISALEMAESPRGTGETIPQWHISITDRGRRPKPNHVRRALRAFGMVGAEEDNHHPGMARNFWQPVDPAHRVDCECKEEDVIVKEPDGYTWSNARDGECRGCELERIMGRVCPIHGGAR